jgi:hypothetical protein
MRSVIELLQVCGQLGIGVSVELLGCDSLITRSRNMLAAKFLNTPAATHLLFVDADIAFDAKEIIRMLQFGEDVVAAMYPLKMILWDGAAKERAAAGESPDTAALRYVGYPAGENEFEERDGFVTARYVGAGCLLIRREALERMTAAFPETRYSAAHTAPGNDASANQYALFDCLIDPDTLHYLSEDYAFCHRWRSIGGRIWLDTRAQLTHVGVHEFVGRPETRFAG